VGLVDGVRVLLVLLLVLGGCAKKRLPVPPPVVRGPSYAELEAGWRVRVISPVLKSGRFILKTAEQQEEGNTITLRAGDEFQGYETATYAVGRHPQGGVRVALTDVILNKGGALKHPAKSFAPRLRMPGRLRHVRLLYTMKVSDADHNMAVLAATNSPRLAALTARVQAAPAAECRVSRNEYCEWIPAGVAVRAEKPRGADWVPAN
jgi:hypothetical protein